MIQLSEFELSIGFEVVVCVGSNELLDSIFFHLHSSLEVSQFIRVKWVERDILYEVLSLEILFLMILDSFEVLFDLLLLLLLV